jgi:uncharacterized protein (DUF58 family)
MLWEKELGTLSKENYYGYLNILAVAAIILSLLLQRPLLLVVAGILYTFLFVSRKYDREIGNDLILLNEKQSIRLFPNGEGKITLTFQNKAFLPINNATLTFEVDDNISIESFKGSVIGEGKVKYEIPLSIVGRGATALSLRVKANQRGITRLRNIQLTFPHMFNFRTISLTYKYMYRTELMVYPKPGLVSGLKEAYFNTLGDQRTNFSPFEDMLNPVGTRDYVRSDPFPRIHWKASVKKQSLQTKVLEKTRDNTWILIINIATKTKMGNMYYSKRMENLLSYATFIAQYATKMGIPFEVYLNTTQGLRLFVGQGKEHLKRAMEFLAKVSDQSILIPFPRLLYKVDFQLTKPHTVVLFGELPDGSLDYLEKWKRKGMNVYKVTDFEDGAALELATKVGDQLVRN